MIKIKTFEFNPFSENTYVVWDDISKEAILIDPGCYSSDEEKLLKSFIINNSLIPKYLINTHCHIDHILGNKFIKSEFDILFYAPDGDLFLLKGLKQQSEMFGLSADDSPLPDERLDEDVELKIGEENFNLIYTPGHTPGGHCIVNYKHKIIFSGDLLFYESIGRTDLPGGDYNAITHSLVNKIMKLDGKFVVYPGHGQTTTINYEKSNNPFIIEMMKADEK